MKLRSIARHAAAVLVGLLATPLAALEPPICLPNGTWTSGGHSALSPASRAATLILHNGEVVLGPEGETVQAIAIENDRVIASGSDAEILGMREPGTLVIDLAGRVVFPSLKDHHVHLLGAGLALLNEEPDARSFVSVSGATPEEIVARVQARAAELAPGTWIIGRGWNHRGWGADSLPTHHLLSDAAPDHPVFLGDSDAHVGWVNAEAMRRAGISTGRPDPAGGWVVRDAAGEPTGVLVERAVEDVIRLIPEPTDELVKRAFRAAAEVFAQRGVTDVYDAGFLGPAGVVDLGAPFERYLRLLAEADRESPLPLRVNVMIPAPSRLAELVLENPESYQDLSSRVRVTHIKLFGDGAFARRGAFLTHPYLNDASTHGVARMTEGEIRDYVDRALRAGLDVATHAIGDAAAQRVLDVYEAALGALPDLDPARLRIEHFCYALPEDYERAARMGIVLTMQPNFASPAYETYVGAERGRRVMALRDLYEMGATMAGSSDSYSVPGNPWGPIVASLTRERSGTAWHPDQVLPRAVGLQMFTRFFAPGGAEATSGTLTVGGPADLVVLSGNPLTVPTEEIRQIQIDLTLLNGEVVTQREGFELDLRPNGRSR